MMSEIASSLMVLIVLALGTFTAGIHVCRLACLRGWNRAGPRRSRHRLVRGDACLSFY